MGGFDDLLTELEGTGWFQNRIAWFLIGPLFFIMPFVFLNQVFVLFIPDHWCAPQPGFDHVTLNISEEAWKQQFLPQEIGPDFLPRASRCQMYSVTSETLPKFVSGELPGNKTWDLLECKNVAGWTYDQSEFTNTAVTENNWVCELEGRATELFTIGNVGLIIGTAIFSALADYKGRRIAFYAATVFVILFQLIQIGVSHIYPLYLTLKILAFAAMLPVFQTPLSISTEISSIKKRAEVIGLGCVTWALGNMALSLVGWLIPRWRWLRVICTIPLIVIYATWKFTPESPRWLITMGRFEEATNIIMDLAKTNKVKVERNYIEGRLREIAAESSKEKSYGYISLFKSRALAIRTFNVTMAFTAAAFVYYQLMINIGNMAGNTFLNMFLLGLVEGPGCILAVWLSDKIGRRWTHTGLLGLSSILFFVIMWVVYYPYLSPLVTVCCMIIKLNISATFVVSYIQAMEVFPTCVRQSGIGFATLISQTISIAGPYVIYLGATDLKLPYLAMFLISGAGAVAVSFLPETLGATLPETLDEASAFGKNDKYFSWRPQSLARVDTEKVDPEEKETLFDWNPIMRDAFQGKPGDDLNATLIKSLLVKYYSNLPEQKL